MRNLKQKDMDYVKANRRGSRDAELENSTGWISKNKAHKSKKQYDRKRIKIDDCGCE